MMTFEQFIEYVAAEIQSILSDDIPDIKVESTTVVKVNDQKLHGIFIMEDEGKACPNFYLDAAYEAYCDGHDPDDIAYDICKQYWVIRHDMTPPTAQVYEEHNQFKDSEFNLRLLDSTRNTEYLQDIPHLEVGNGFVLICDVRVISSDNGIYSSVINDSMLDSLEMSADELFERALSNAWDNDTPLLYSMEEKLLNYYKYDEYRMTNLLTASKLRPQQLQYPMYLLSTDSGIYGAAALFFPGVQERIAQVFKDDYYVLTSSTEDVIIVPLTNAGPVSMYTDMVNDMNNTVMEPHEILSDKVLRYYRKSGKLRDVTARIA
ncbi:MAG: DUF5688 family protein [Firmicutes bacterium]|nr:DUF5688 family protein [Bacillota bacterium]